MSKIKATKNNNKISKKEAVQFFMDYIYEDVAVVYLKPLYYQEDEFDFKHMFRAVKIS